MNGLSLSFLLSLTHPLTKAYWLSLEHSDFLLNFFMVLYETELRGIISTQTDNMKLFWRLTWHIYSKSCELER